MLWLAAKQSHVLALLRSEIEKVTQVSALLELRLGYISTRKLNYVFIH